MIPPAFDYAEPKTLEEAIALLANPEAKILAGGHSLIPMLKFRLATPALLVDINKIEGLSYIHEDDDWLKIGAMTREYDLEMSALVQTRYPLLADAAKLIADPIVRHWATVGGNLAHADPANDHPAVMLAYGAEIVARGPNGERVIPITEFFVGPFTPALESNEILTEIRIPKARAGDGGAYMKIERKVGDYATAAVGVQLHMNDGRVERAGIGLTNLGLMPIHATAAQEALVGQPLSDATIAAAAQAAGGAADAVSDYRGSEDYKRALVRTLTTRAIRKAAERAN